MPMVVGVTSNSSASTLRGAHLALVEHRYQDTFGVGDLFKEHTPAGSG
jgi:hypothetical protein